MEESINKLKRSEIEKNIELKNKILSFLSDNKIELDWISNYKQIIYHYINDIKEIPKCYCGKFNNFKSAVFGYRKTCSFKCSNSSEKKIKKIKNSKFEKYGDENYNNPGKGKKTKKERYGDENYNNRESAFKTNEIRYGSYSAMKNENTIKLGKETKQRRYDNPNYNNIEKTKEFWKNIDDNYKTLFINKGKETRYEKYGDKNYNNRNKGIITHIERYGYYYNNPDKANLTKIERGVIKTGDILKDWQYYKSKVRSITRKNKKLLYENWDGYDYYDNELIKGYLSYSHVHRFYPTMDHKISVYFGFVNNIDPEDIGSIDNLCLTKRYINSIKNKLIESDFSILKVNI